MESWLTLATCIWLTECWSASLVSHYPAKLAEPKYSQPISISSARCALLLLPVVCRGSAAYAQGSMRPATS